MQHINSMIANGTMQYNMELIVELLIIFFGLGGIGMIGLVIVCAPFWLASWILKIGIAFIGGLWHRIIG